MRNNIQCPICGNTNTVILENNIYRIIKLRHPEILFSNKQNVDVFASLYFCSKCNFQYKYNNIGGYFIGFSKKM